MRRYLKFSPLLLCLLLTVNGFAQGMRGGILFAGASLYFPVEENIAIGYGSSLGSSFHLTRNVSILFRWDYGRYDVEREEGKLLNGKLFITPLSLSFKYSFIDNPSFSAYAFMGAGIIFSSFQIGERETPEDADVIEQDIKNGIGLHVGLGSLFRLTDRLAIYAEGVYLRRKTDVTTTSRTLLGTSSVEFSQNLDSYNVIVGLRYFF
jgi:opacity protein-like surface antigen